MRINNIYKHGFDDRDDSFFPFYPKINGLVSHSDWTAFNRFE